MGWLSDGPLPFGSLAVVSAEYREFACSVATFEWLAGGGMTSLDGMPVRLQMMDVLKGGHNVMVKVWDSPERLDEARDLHVRAAGWRVAA